MITSYRDKPSLLINWRGVQGSNADTTEQVQRTSRRCYSNTGLNSVMDSVCVITDLKKRLQGQINGIGETEEIGER